MMPHATPVRQRLIIYGQPPDACSLDDVTQACFNVLAGTVPSPTAPITELTRSGILREQAGRLGFGDGVIEVSPALVTDLRRIAVHAAADYADILAARMAEMPGGALDLIRDRPDGRHILVGGIILDLGIRSCLLQDGIFRAQPDACWVWIYPAGTDGGEIYGVRSWRSGDDGTSLSQLWHDSLVRSRPLLLSRQDMDVLARAADEGGLPKSGLPPALLRSVIKLLFLELLALEGDIYRPTSPVFDPRRDNSVVSWGLAAARAIHEGAVLPALEQAERAFERAGITAIREIHRHGFLRLLLEQGMGDVIRRGLVPPFPASASSVWGSWMLRNDLVSLLLDRSPGGHA